MFHTRQKVTKVVTESGIKAQTDYLAGGSHKISSFNNNLKAFTSAFLQGGTSQEIINSFIKKMKDEYGVKVTIKE